jgi:DNA-binding response OmpR family regulator
MKIIYMSGYTEDTLVQHGVTELSMAFLQKPFKPIELARRVYAVLHPPGGR